MDTIAEQQCIDACRAGRAGAYRPLVDAYYPRSVRLAVALVGNSEDARDIAQEAFVAAYQALPQHIAGRPFYPWLRGLLVNRAKVCIRSRNRARARRQSAAERPGHWAALRVESAASRPRDDLIHRALEMLDESERSLVVLKHVEGYTYDELAAALGIPRGTVMSRLYRARAHLRAALEELDPGLVESYARNNEQEKS